MRTFSLDRWIRTLATTGLAVGLLVPTSRGQALEWRDFAEAMAVADSTNRFVLVAVHAPWCGWCRKMKTEVYPSDPVRSCLADHFVLTRLNRDDTETTYPYQGQRLPARRLASRLQADSVPTTVLLSPRGEYLLHLSGFIKPNPLGLVLAYISTRAYRHTPYTDYRSEASPQCDGSNSPEEHTDT